MEEHRLKEMPTGYDQRLFEDIFNKTSKLRNKLSNEISLDRFPGMERKDIKSWFNVKFIYAFQKYYPIHKDPEILKAHIIQSIQLFKCRILRKAYSKQNEIMMESIAIDDCQEAYDIQLEQEDDSGIKLVLMNLNKKLNTGDFNVLLAQLYPPEYILHRIKPTQLNRIPAELIGEYFSMSIEEVHSTRKRIRKAIEDSKKELGFILLQ